MEEQRANARQSADDRNTETAEAKVKAIFMDLYNYFRMDSSMDPIVLFEQLCCVLIQLQSRTDLHSFGGIEDDPTAQYYGLMEQFQLSAVGRRVTTEPFMMRDQPKLIRRLMNAADGAVELIRDGRGLVPPLFDFLDTILQERRGETVGTPLQTAREIVKLVHQSGQMSLQRRWTRPVEAEPFCSLCWNRAKCNPPLFSVKWRDWSGTNTSETA